MENAIEMDDEDGYPYDLGNLKIREIWHPQKFNRLTMIMNDI